jgi:hypothetical protein
MSNFCVLWVLRCAQESLSFEDSGEGSGSDGESDEAAAAEESDSSEDEVKHLRSWCLRCLNY